MSEPFDNTHYYDSFLEELLGKQVALNTKIGHNLITDDVRKKEVLTKEFTLAIMAELSEVLGWMNWKIWKKQRIEYTAESIKELQFELIDILHFWANLCILWDMTPSKIIELYREKNLINHHRQNTGY